MNPCLSVNRKVLICVLLTLLLPFILFGHSLAQQTAEVKTIPEIKDSGYKLFIKDQRITLNSKDASLKMILEEIGQKINVEMIVRIPKEKKVTVQFNDKSLEDALKLFKVNYAMVADSEDKGGNIKRIVVVPEGQQAQKAKSTSGISDKQQKTGLEKEVRSNNEPFKFEFDPSKIIDKEK